MISIAENLEKAGNRILEAARTAGRDPKSVALLAVSKKQPAEQLREAARQGQLAFGENYLQEALDKMAALADIEGLSWHFIGPIQSNKTRDIARHFDWVHSVDRLKTARRLSEQRGSDLPPMNLCIQVNIDEEPTKSGVHPGDVVALGEQVAALPNVRLRGLMAIPDPNNSPAAQRERFRALAALLDELGQSVDNDNLDTLSMGMSGDLELAIAEGATIVRIGTAIFGPRD